MKRLFFVCSCIWALTFLISCQKEDENEEPQPVSQLKAVAGPDQQVEVNTLVSLDGSASKDGKDKPHQYVWTILTKPEGSEADLVDEGKAKATFTPDLAGEYNIELTVYNVIGNEHADEIKVTATSESTEPVTQVIIQEDIETETVLSNIFVEPAKADYLVKDLIAVKAPLIIEAGVTIAFEADQGMIVTSPGYLKALGTEDDSVKLTGKEKTEGYWKGIVFNSPSPENALNYTEISYGGSEALPGMEAAANLGLDGEDFGFIKLNHTAITHSKHYGLYAEKGSDMEMRSSIYLGNDIPIAIPLDLARKLDANSELDQSNHNPRIEIIEGTIPPLEAMTISRFAGAMEYLVSKNIEIYGGLHIEAGVSLAFGQDKSLMVKEQAYISVKGSASNPVIFTSADQHHGHWAGILIESANQLNELDFIDLTRAGSTLLPGISVSSGIALEGDKQARLKLTNSFVGYNVGDALHVEPGAWLSSKNNQIVDSQNHELSEVLKGKWLDSWSFQQSYTIDDKFYDATTGIWFRGANSPWDMNPRPGTGFSVQENSDFVWNYELSTDVGGCQSYTVEFVGGKVSTEGNTIIFAPTVRRRKYHSTCEPSLNFDQDESTESFAMVCELFQETNELGVTVWELKLHHENGAYSQYYKLK
ncbi:hypothetical protein OKW21_004262 [Catalinimonas alkaloidigena]|uniref:PKD domain-containing protein n=1 Tax=Catalinimonas alkaloidigena TaxID=1075417 RepID=UPI002406CE9E|nr:hypothetical protein [Catalinimonas alkaloidigena]MDF9798999.1 hypothetical protein [Catalinimonas alkaloidigena]